MDGFNLFQEKIIGQVNNKKGADPKIMFYQQESLPSDDFQWVGSEMDLLSYGQFGHSSLDIIDSDFCDYSNEVASSVEFKIEYGEKTTEPFEDFRDVLFNFNNGINSENKKTMIVFFD